MQINKNVVVSSAIIIAVSPPYTDVLKGDMPPLEGK